MTLILTIENEQSLPNGAPVSVRLTDRRGIDIGRSASIDWSLPDPTRFISGRHCEVRYRDDGYWLNDLSTNGTFLNDSARRIQAPHKLRHGDRLAIGAYVIAVAIETDGEPESDIVDGADADAAAAESVAALAPIQPKDAAALDAEIAQAIAIETASDAAPPLQTQPEPQVDATSRTSGSASVFELPPVNRGGAPAPPPFTMIRARGFPSPPAPFRETAERPPEARSFTAPSPEAEGASLVASPPPDAATTSRAQSPEAETADAPLIDAQEAEARAWKTPERIAQTKILDEPAGACAESPAADVNAGAAKASSAPAPGLDDFLRSFAKGAGIPEHIFARQDGLKVAEDLGALMRMAVSDLTQLLSARFKAKRFARTSSQTMIQALDNNPLKFAPTADDALKIMFGPRTSGYLDAKRAFEGAFTDLKTHQINTFAAMQQAVRMLVEDLDPKVIEDAAGEDKGLAALFGAHKARLWDLYLARWQAKTLRHEDGLVDAFMLYFAQCYDEAREPK